MISHPEVIIADCCFPTEAVGIWLGVCFCFSPRLAHTHTQRTTFRLSLAWNWDRFKFLLPVKYMYRLTDWAGSFSVSSTQAVIYYNIVVICDYWIWKARCRNTCYWYTMDRKPRLRKGKMLLLWSSVYIYFFFRAAQQVELYTCWPKFWCKISLVLNYFAWLSDSVYFGSKVLMKKFILFDKMNWEVITVFQ